MPDKLCIASLLELLTLEHMFRQRDLERVREAVDRQQAQGALTEIFLASLHWQRPSIVESFGSFDRLKLPA